MNNFYHQQIPSFQRFDLKHFTDSLEVLRSSADTLHAQYVSAEPFPHAVIDNLFSPEILNRVLAEFPSQQNRQWQDWDTQYQVKSTSPGLTGLPTFIQLFCLWLGSAEFTAEISKITGIEDIYPDPMYHGAGLHEMFRDGWLDIHADHTKHYYLPMMRRINLLIYLNHDWDEDWGGGLELWDYEDHQKRVCYPPHFNRTVIFPTTDQTLHGVPRPLSCPPNRSRKLVSIYYWTPIPMPFLFKAGTPILWLSDRKRNLKRGLDKVKMLFQ